MREDGVKLTSGSFLDGRFIFPDSAFHLKKEEQGEYREKRGIDGIQKKSNRKNTEKKGQYEENRERKEEYEEYREKRAIEEYREK